MANKSQREEKRLGIKYGAVFGAALILYGLFFRWMDFHYESGWAWVFFVILILGVGAGQWADYQAGGTKWHSVRTGATVGVVSSTLYGIKVWLYNWLVSDSLLEDVRVGILQRLDIASHAGEELERTLAQIDFSLRPEIFATAVTVRLVLIAVAFALLFGLVLRFSPLGSRTAG